LDRWKRVADALRDAGITVLPDAAREGVCLQSCCVVTDGGWSDMGRGSVGGRARCRIWLLCPRERPEALAQLARLVRVALRPLEDRRILFLASPRSATVVEPEWDALSAYIEYDMYYSDLK